MLSGVALGLFLAGPLAGQDRIDWSGALDRGDELEIRGISGDVRATFVAGNTARVEATKTGRDSDFDDVRILVDEDRGGVTICAVYGDEDRESCHDDGHRHGDGHRNIRVSVDFVVQVPAGVTFRPSIVSGDIDADGLHSDIFANTVSGSIRVSTEGIVEARTVSGSIDADMGARDIPNLEFQTVSGDITLFLRADADVDVRVSTLSGAFSSELPLEITRRRDRFVGSTVRGRLGDGGAILRFETVSGDIDLRERRE
ncbi:MAG: DUF4097 domain-containing protein [Gemmatimonadota bacterium]|nr:DUF4097 domain-containing protein [Gemmatimonadota bacterium]